MSDSKIVKLDGTPATDSETGEEVRRPDAVNAAGVPIEPAFWMGTGGVIYMRDATGKKCGTPVGVKPGSLVVIIPSPAGAEIFAQLQLARTMGAGGVIHAAGEIV